MLLERVTFPQATSVCGAELRSPPGSAYRMNPGKDVDLGNVSFLIPGTKLGSDRPSRLRWASSKA